MAKTAKSSADYILPLYMNGLSGRMLRLPAPPKKHREILMIYGHHTSIERMMGWAEFANHYGSVTLPDLPGFGGMQPFYKIGEKPTIDNLADYLAAFIKMRFRGKRFSIIGLSLGFAIVTRMLQRYPEIVKQVDLLISTAGFVHKDDFIFKRRNFYLLRYASSLCSTRPVAALGKYVVLRAPFIRLGYRLFEGVGKMTDADSEEYQNRINFEIGLWQSNDFRSYAETAVSMFTMDLTGKPVNLPVYHIGVDGDRYFNNTLVEQHMRTIYKDFQLVKTELKLHMPTVLATSKEAAPFVPPSVRRLLNKRQRSILKS